MSPAGDTRPLRVLVVDDSATARAAIAAVIEATPDMTVAGIAADGLEAVAQTVALRPDVITMDVHMPNLDGLAASREIMATHPTPIVVVSSTLSADNVEATLRVLETGAVAAVPRPADAHDDAELVRTLRLMADVKVVRRPRPAAPRPRHRPIPSPAAGGEATHVGIAASTGGPAALYRILQDLPPSVAAPILVVQHLSRGFLDGFVAWLRTASERDVSIAESGVRPRPRTVYIAPDDLHLGLGLNGTLRISPKDPVRGFRPSATFLFETMATHLGPRGLGIILTGMGDDGVDGLRSLHAAGGTVIGQDPATSAVYGMPGAAWDAGVVDHRLPLGAIAPAVARLCLHDRAAP